MSEKGKGRETARKRGRGREEEGGREKGRERERWVESGKEPEKDRAANTGNALYIQTEGLLFKE